MCERDICAAAHKRMQNSLFRALRHTAAPSHSPRQIRRFAVAVEVTVGDPCNVAPRLRSAWPPRAARQIEGTGYLAAPAMNAATM